MTPDFQISAQGVNITNQIKERLLRLVISDEAGGKSDAVEIVLDDRNNAIELPSPGAILSISMGYKETFLVPMGQFTADEVRAKGPPDTVTIRGTAADMGGTIKEQKTRNWDDQTIGSIVTVIAGNHGLKPKVSDAYRDIAYDHLDQTDESDMNFLTRLGQDHDAIVSIKSGILLFSGKGEGKTVSGQPMDPRPITRAGDIRWDMTLTNRGNYRSVIASWHDTETGQRQKVTVGEGSPAKRLRHPYADAEEARRAATAQLDEVTRGRDKLRITLPGDPLIAAEGQVLATGFRAGVNGIWSVTSARHQIAGQGFQTTIETEKPKAEDEG